MYYDSLHVLGFTKDTSTDRSEFCGSADSLDKHTLFALEESDPPSDDLHLRVPVGNPALIGLDLPLTALVDITERKRKILTCTQTKQKSQKQKLERLRSTRLIRRDLKAMNSRHAKVSSEIMDSSLLAPTTNHF
jgi:hypothetical protein